MKTGYRKKGEVLTDSLPYYMDIPGYEGRYYVCQDGTVWRRCKDTRKDYQLTGTVKRRNKDIKLTDATGKTTCKSMSSIMKETYFRGLPAGLVLMHKNGMVDDWSIANLRPIKREQLGRLKNRTMAAKCVEKRDQTSGTVIEIYRSAREAGRKNFCSYQTILDACNEKNKRRPGIAPDGYRYCWET